MNASTHGHCLCKVPAILCLLHCAVVVSRNFYQAFILSLYALRMIAKNYIVVSFKYSALTQFTDTDKP